MEQDNLSLFLQDILGISQSTTNRIISTLEEDGELENAQQSIDELYDELDLLSNEEPSEDIDLNIDSIYDKHETDEWNPEQDDIRAQTDYDTQPSVTNKNDYKPRMEGVKHTFLSYLNETINADATLMSMGDEIESQLNPIIKKRIDALNKMGNTVAANQLRDRELKKIKANKPQQPLTGAQAQVVNKKQQLAKAVDIARREQQAQARRRGDRDDVEFM